VRRGGCPVQHGNRWRRIRAIIAGFALCEAKAPETTPMRTAFLILFLLLPGQDLRAASAKKLPVPLDPGRIEQIAAMLPAEPRSVGDPISERSRWDELRLHPAFVKVIPEAERLLKTAIPEKPEALVLDYKNTGNRNNWQRVDSAWRVRLNTLFLAECMENQGRFLPALEEIIIAFCDEPTWVMPAHDRNQDSYYGRASYADLKAAGLGMNLGIIHHVIGEKLSPGLRKRIKDEVMRRNLEPYRKLVTGKDSLGWWWITGTNNWNAVCQAGITGAALAFVEDPRERAVFIAAAEVYSKYFLGGFTPDGYCSEGMGYWCYGYGHYILLTEFIHAATGGMIDLLECEGARAAGRFGGVLEIRNGIHPAFADCSVGSRPTDVLMYYLSRRYGFGFEEWDKIDPVGLSSHLAATMAFSFPNSADRCQPKKPDGPRLEMRTWFSDAGVLICRPGNATSTRLAAAMKAGHNAEHHNHNDVGSYLVVSGAEALLVDPGAEVYTRRTFSSERYVSKVLNSLGHPVPVVAGKLQSKGSKARGEVVSTSFTGEADQLVIEMKSAYAVPELTSLQRSFEYLREGSGTFRVSDKVVFDSPQSFETAVVTLSKWAQKDKNTLSFRDFEEGIEVRIDVTGGEFEIVPVQIDEDVRTKTKPTRIGIRMKEAVKEATISLTITPDGSAQSGQLFNGGFETGKPGSVKPVIVLGDGEEKKWSRFSKQFTTPPNTETIRLWVHSMNGAVVDAVLDEIEIGEP